jgi:putative hydrolase of HD superfamily
MDPARIEGILTFIGEAERLKNVLRSAWTTTGRQESTTDHSWRLCLLAMMLERDLGDVDFSRVLKMAIVHDLGEALGGDVPAPLASAAPDKHARERADLLTLTAALPDDLRDELLELWDEYGAAETPEARLVKGLDKLETIIQHNQGENPPWLDYDFNIDYGERYTRDHALLGAIREQVDVDTRRNAARRRDLFGAGEHAPDAKRRA